MQQGLTNAELEAALRLVFHFPRGMSGEFLRAFNGASAEALEAGIREIASGLVRAQAVIPTDQAPPTKKTKKLLQPVTTIPVPAVPEFIAANKFKVGETVDGVQIFRSMGDNFKTHFLPKVERYVFEVEIRVHKLLCGSRDLGIRAEIGEENEETFLANLWEMLKLQGDGRAGALLTNGSANIFYIRGIDGNLWAVYANWVGDGWFLSANSVDVPHEWGADRLVCSR